MDFKHFQRLFSTFPRENPKTRSYLDWLGTPKLSVRMHYPLEVKSYGNQIYKYFAKQPIQAGKQILLVSTQKCFTNVELVGCTPARAADIENITSSIANKYHPNNPDQQLFVNGLLKILIQLFVHYNDKGMSLNPFANFLMDEKVRSPLYWRKETFSELYSLNMVKNIKGTRQQVNGFLEELKDKKIYGINEELILGLMQTIRRNILCFTPQQPKAFSSDSLLIISPLVSHVTHSFDPNCAISGFYMSHENQSFVTLNTIKDIQEDEVLTINYGNLHNSDFILRYGFIPKNNPYNQVNLELDFERYWQLSNQLFDFKQKLLRSSHIMDIENQIIYPNRINADLLRYLRIYFLSENDLKSNMKIASYLYSDFDKTISKQNDKRVFKFLLENLEKQLELYQRNKALTLKHKSIKENQIDPNIDLSLSDLQDLDQLKPGEYKDMLHLCLEEEQIIKNNVSFVKKMLNEI